MSEQASTKIPSSPPPQAARPRRERLTYEEQSAALSVAETVVPHMIRACDEQALNPRGRELARRAAIDWLRRWAV